MRISYSAPNYTPYEPKTQIIIVANPPSGPEESILKTSTIFGKPRVLVRLHQTSTTRDSHAPCSQTPADHHHGYLFRCNGFYSSTCICFVCRRDTSHVNSGKRCCSVRRTITRQHIIVMSDGTLRWHWVAAQQGIPWRWKTAVKVFQ